MKLAIIGGGAIGQYIAFRLNGCKDIEQCDVLMHRPRQGEGLIVRSILGDAALPQFHWRNIHEVQPGEYDTFILTTKTTTMPVIAGFLKRVLTPGDQVWNTQNGWGNEQWLKNHTGHEQCAVMSINFGVERYNDGEIAHKVGNLAVLAGASSENTEVMKRIFVDAGADTEVMSSPEACRLNKLLWIIPFSGTSLVTDRYPCNLASDTEIQQRLSRLMAEVAQIAERYAFDIPEEKRDYLIRFTQTIAPTWPSMVQDFHQSRPIEIEFIYQHLLKEAARLHITTPHLRSLYHQMIEVMSKKYLHDGNAAGF